MTLWQRDTLREFANYEQDYRDLCQIVKFIQDDLQCKVACIVGHSQSAAALIKYPSAHDNSQYQHTCYVNLAGRYLLPNNFNPDTIFDQDQCRQLTKQRFFDLIKSGESDMNRSLQFRQEDVIIEMHLIYPLPRMVSNDRTC